MIFQTSTENEIMSDDTPNGLSADRIVYAGHTRGEIEAAFDLVRDPSNWKMAINKILPGETSEEQIRLIDAAVAFYTGGTIETVRTAEGIRVTSEGYYVNIGA